MPAPSGMGSLAKTEAYPYCQRLPLRGSWRTKCDGRSFLLFKNQNRTAAFWAEEHTFCAPHPPAERRQRRSRPWRQGLKLRQSRLCQHIQRNECTPGIIVLRLQQAGQHPIGVGCQKCPVVPGSGFGQLPRIPPAGQSRALPSHWHRRHRGPAGRSRRILRGGICSLKNTAGNDIWRKRCTEKDVGGVSSISSPVGGIPQRRQRAAVPAGQNSARTASVMLFTRANRPVGSSKACLHPDGLQRKAVQNTSLPAGLPVPTVSGRSLRHVVSAYWGYRGDPRPHPSAHLFRPGYRTAPRCF